MSNCFYVRNVRTHITSVWQYSELTEPRACVQHTSTLRYTLTWVNEIMPRHTHTKYRANSTQSHSFSQKLTKCTWLFKVSTRSTWFPALLQTDTHRAFWQNKLPPICWHQRMSAITAPESKLPVFLSQTLWMLITVLRI